MSTIKNLQGKKIAILGLGLENLALVKYLLKHKIDADITICDARKDVKAKNPWIPACAGMTKIHIRWQLSKGYNKNLNKFDVLFRSPGWPIIPLAPFIKGVSSPMQLFFELCPTKNIIGVTGTKGKGTTASLIYEILKTAAKRVWLGGNIGVAPFDFLDKLKKTDWVVLELSSFQLEDMTVSPHIAVITNFYPEHLAPADPNNPNYHKSLKDYRDAKLNIVRWQKQDDYIIFNSKFKIQNSKLQVKSQKLFFEKLKLPSRLIGEHNEENVAAAAAVAKIIGVKQGIIKKAVANFKGLEHRLEFFRELNGVKYYNDSFATTPESTITALKSFNQPIILLAGGAEKKSNFSQLVRKIKKRVKFAVLIKGVATARLKRELFKAGYPNYKIRLVNSMRGAVARASQQALKGDIILLSPACASFGMFKNYKERGNLFKQAVKKLTQLNNFVSCKISPAKQDYLTGLK